MSVCVFFLPKDLANSRLDMVLFYSEASHRYWEGLGMEGGRVLTPSREKSLLENKTNRKVPLGSATLGRRNFLKYNLKWGWGRLYLSYPPPGPLEAIGGLITTELLFL